MSADDLDQTQFTHPHFWKSDPRLDPLLPLIYVAWSDSTLSEDQLRELREKARELLGDQLGQTLGHWLDPEMPPRPHQLQRILRRIREQAGDLSGKGRLTMAELGRKLAQRSSDQPHAEQTQRALEHLEQALGVVGHEAVSEMLAPPVTRRVRLVRAEVGFDVAAMARLLDGAQHETREQVRLLLGKGFIQPVELSKEQYRAQVLEWLGVLAEAGLGALGFPGITTDSPDLGRFVTAFETLALFDLSLAIRFGVQFGLFGGSIFFLGSERHHRAYLPRVASAELLGCFAMTETGHGSNVGGIETTATYLPERDVIRIDTPTESARKDYIGNATAAMMATVFAQLEVDGESHGVHAFLVPLRDEAGALLPGIRVGDCGHKMGLNGVDNGRLWFDGVEIPRANLLDRFAQIEDGGYVSPIPSPSRRFFTMIGTLVGGRISIACASLSVASSALTIAIRYGNRRHQFGPAGEAEMAILDYQTHQLRLMPLLATSYALRFALDALVRRFCAADKDRTAAREVEGLAAGLKAYASWHASRTAQVCRESCGGAGYLSENRFGALKADSEIFSTFEGDNTVLLQLVAKGLLSSYAHQFSEMSFFGILRHLVDRVSKEFADQNQYTIRRTDQAHLRDPELQIELLRAREHDLLASVARRIKRRIDGGMDSFLAFTECQNHLMDLAHASVEREIVEQFHLAIEALGDDPLAEQLVPLRDLTALWHVERDIGWFLENDYMEGAKARALRDQVQALCSEVRQIAVGLVDAFGIPQNCLGAPIARPT